MVKKRTPRKRRATRTATTAKRRSTASRRQKSDKVINFFVPLFFMIAIVVCLGMVLFVGFRSVSASEFFEIEKIETYGVRNITKEKIEAVVRTRAAGKGIWEADLEGIREEISKIDYVKDVSVSRVLPETIKVIVIEREPIALVVIDGKKFRVDEDGKLLEEVVDKVEEDPLFSIHGWSGERSNKARELNLRRLELYKKLREEWVAYDLSKRVTAVDLQNPRDVQAYITDSGESVALSLGDKDYGKRLKEGLKHIAGQGKKVSKIILDGASPVVVYRD